MNKIKFILATFVSISCIASIVIWIYIAADKYYAIPYMKKINEHQKYSLQEMLFIERLQDNKKQRKRITNKKIENYLLDSLEKKESDIYNEILLFPRKYEDLKECAIKLHEATEQIRTYKDNRFIHYDSITPLVQYKLVYDSIVKNNRTFSIIFQEEVKNFTKTIFFQHQ